MIPVSLRLRNFLSYIDPDQPLDFEQFHVACLSGPNGHGKSALLDAVTWALWGEARKSSGSYKPDEELIHTGARDMQVELVFDLDGERYRVARAYYRSATGKTSRPELEVQVYDGAAGEYRPLTGHSVKETQEQLQNILGLDYNTFINSAFLLQGRSDEFTKKKPTDRKEILARILSLDRYEVLADLARERERAAAESIRRADEEIERLTEAVAPEQQWIEERGQVESAIDRDEKTARQLDEEIAQVGTRLAALEAKASQAQSVREAISGAQSQREHHEKEARALEQRIAEAQRLLSQSDAIHQAAQRYEALIEERGRLDEKSGLHRGVEVQLGQRHLDLQRQKHELELKVANLEMQIRADRVNLNTHETQLLEAPQVREALLTSRKATSEMRRLTDLVAQRKRLEEQVVGVEKALAAERAALEGQLRQMQEQIEQAGTLPSLRELQERESKLKRSNEELEQRKKQMEHLLSEGTELRAAIEARQQQKEEWRAEIERLFEKIERVQMAEDGDCPTCGTPLTDEHRRKVEQHYRDEVSALRERVAGVEKWIDEQEQRREALRDRYRQMQHQIESANGLAEELAHVREKIYCYERDLNTIQTLRERSGRLKQQLDQHDFGLELRRRREDLDQQLADMPFDEQHFDQVRVEAAQVKRLEEQERQLVQVRALVEQLNATVKQRQRDLDALRKELQDGTAFRTIQDHIARLNKQLQQIGYDPARHAEVRKQLHELRDAPIRLTSLMDAQQNFKDWTERHQVTEQLLAQIREEIARQQANLELLEADLAKKPEVVQHQKALMKRRAAVQAELDNHRKTLGQLTERLNQCRRDREALAMHQKGRREAEAERRLYGELRKAFGRHGIPSLIIEQTLPDIESRANDILDRLTDGRTHVHLETLRNKKSGGTKETLEIKITDEQGVARAYETFSGGEAFRIDFALRMALAQLLAERNGVRIRTLVIDEGFGTQDRQGMQNLIEAIQSIREDFDKILVITHIDELKEAFPVRIEVEKHPVQGSSYQVVGV